MHTIDIWRPLSHQETAPLAAVLTSLLPQAETIGALGAALKLYGIQATPQIVMTAIRCDLTTTFGVRIGELAVLGYTTNCLACAFTAQGVRGSTIRSASRPAGVRDPVGLLWPWGVGEADMFMQPFNDGVAALLNGEWAEAVATIQDTWMSSAISLETRLLLERARAANIALAVASSHSN